MVSVYNLRPVYTFLYIIINGNVIASFVQKKIVLRFCGPKIVFLRTYATLSPAPPPPPRGGIVRIWLDLSPPFVRTYYVDDPILRLLDLTRGKLNKQNQFYFF